ncbi:SAM-dependent methyltransferase [Actinophytocola sp.]|uniref:SAM-dependent methyltransferase n=1 Tax=Actinophytocola sp. TaxID=1872138 RepID=UPI002D802EF6|nr:SAM-dependent methyltransferase [Actinophytocola sp.]HET9141697.1 SAM-dependent methyltransferase [Actinophytocola sp.]
MTGHVRRVPPPVDTGAPHPARVHDYLLGGGHNFAADRELAEKVKQQLPAMEDVARLNQAFLRRATLYLVDTGIRQFLDIGSGIPTLSTLHGLVQRAAPDARWVYVDMDPVAIAHTEMKLADAEGTAVLQADLRDAAGILDSDLVRRLINLDEPLGLIAPMLHFVPDAWDPAGVLAGYRDRIAPGSHLVAAHLTLDQNTPGLPEAIELYAGTRYQVVPRTHAEVLDLCAGFTLVPPGLVGFGDWRPESPGDSSSDPAINSVVWAAVGRKP